MKLRRSLDPDRLRLLTEADLHVGLGLTVRGSRPRLVLLGRRGNRAAQSPRACARSSWRRCASVHASRTNSTARVERYCDGPYLELFARERRPGWDAWGDQADKFSKGGVM